MFDVPQMSIHMFRNTAIIIITVTIHLTHNTTCFGETLGLLHVHSTVHICIQLPSKSQAKVTALYFLNLFQADSQAGKILLQPSKLYLVITYFPASIYNNYVRGKTRF